MAASPEVCKSLRLTPVGESDEDKLRFIEYITENCDEMQQRVLYDILKQNGDTEYLRRYGLSGSSDRSAFKSKIPIVFYEDLQPDIQRIANGDHSAILSGHPISEFFTSSGTTAGERKLMPTIDEELDRRQLLYSLIMPVMKQFIPGIDQGKGLYFYFVKSETRTPGGFIARPALTSYYNSHHFKNSGGITSPIAAILCPDSSQSMYIQIICGLYLRLHVLRIGSVFASGLLRAVRFLQTNWHLLAADIASGTLSSAITDPTLRAAVADIIRPDPLLSRLISDECSNPNWSGIITRIWPNTKYLDIIVTGTMAQYIPTLQFYSGGLPMASTIYGSSECYFGINLKPICPPSEALYTILPYLGYFEFLPLNGGPAVDLTEVELDKEYEIVVTTYAGLYRYRVGDVLKVAGFHHSAPQFQFLRRKNVILSIESDKTDEAELHKAVEAAAELLVAVGSNVAEYTSHAYTKEIPGHYVIYWELLRRHPPAAGQEEEVLKRCCLAMEEELNSVYRQSRVENSSIGPLEIRVVQTGSFELLMDYALSKGASINQYKVPRCVNSEPILNLLDSRVESAYFSPELPRWKPNRFD